MKSTIVIKTSDIEDFETKLQLAADILRSGGLVAFPTETVYGLGADAFNEDAVRRVYEVKGRPADNPLIVHVASLKNAELFAEEIPKKGRMLAERFWPGPLTLVISGKKNIPPVVTSGLRTIALRVPKNTATIRLLELFGGGLVGPSANLSGKPSPTEAEHVLSDLNGSIDAIIDDGRTDIGIESTVLDVTIDPPLILRKGGLSKEAIERVIGKTGAATQEIDLGRSPGMRHRHYAPKAQLILVKESDSDNFQRLSKDFRRQKKNVAAITHSIELTDPFRFTRHMENSAEEYARNIFRLLRECDIIGVDVILIEEIEDHGIGAAVMDRLRRAAEH
ncbi:MAG: L-threonylcarbamoyladenylate synthase [Bacteroidota bacterium]